MKKLIGFMFVSVLMLMAGPAWSDSALHIVTCSQDDDTSDEQIENAAAAWLNAAKTVKGGENLRLLMNFPVAAKAGEIDFALIVIAPSFAEWGAFMDNYAGSAAEAVDGKHEGAMDCSNGTLWESLEVK